MNPAAPESPGQPRDGFSFREADLALWREALAQLRHLSDDVWTGLKVFLACNGFIFLALGILIARSRGGKPGVILIALLSVLGILLTRVARHILKRHRIYYLQMLAKKSLLEEDLGFYRARFANSPADLAFPWRLTPEVVTEIRKNPEAWVQESVRGPGTIARFQFLIYEALIGIYGLALAFSIVALLR